MEVIFAPIERMEERYSAQWHDWFMRDFHDAGIMPYVVGGDSKVKIQDGEFLDVFKTNRYKASQMDEIIRVIKKARSAVVFFMDLWFPSIEMIAYIRDCLNLDIKIVGILHAGTWDEHDFLTKSGVAKWGKSFERSIIDIADEIYVATNFHKTMIEKYFESSFSKIKIVKFPVFYSDRLYNNRNRQNLVIFPHRLADEKQPQVFIELEKRYVSKYGRDTRFIRTKDICKTKKEYYTLMSNSRCVFSSALQETFGIAMLEGVNCGCIPVAPNRLSYVETLSEFGLYNDISEAVEMVRMAITNYNKPVSKYNDSTKEIIKCIREKL